VDYGASARFGPVEHPRASPLHGLLIAHRHKTLAKAKSRLFFALESLAGVHFLHQFSLNFFLSLLAKVLALPHQTDSDSSQAARIAQIPGTLIAQVAMRDSCGL